MEPFKGDMYRLLCHEGENNLFLFPRVIFFLWASDNSNNNNKSCLLFVWWTRLKSWACFYCSSNKKKTHNNKLKDRGTSKGQAALGLKNGAESLGTSYQAIKKLIARNLFVSGNYCNVMSTGFRTTPNVLMAASSTCALSRAWPSNFIKIC